MSAAILGPYGGGGGSTFDDGWHNGGVSKLTIYYETTIVRGLVVLYGNGTSNTHGLATGFKQEIDFTSSSAVDMSVTVGTHSYFSGDSNNMGVVALGIASSEAPNSLPSGSNGTVFRPKVLGFFGRSGDALDSLGMYISN